MEKEELVFQEEEEEEEIGLLVRGSKSNLESEIPKEVRSNCDVEGNGCANSPKVTESGAQDSTFNGDHDVAEEHVNPTHNLESEIPKEVTNYCDVERNGSANSPKKTENGAQNSTFNGAHEVAEEHVNPTPFDTVEIKPRLENCVYYDKDEDGKLTPTSSVKESNGMNPGDVSVNGNLLTDLQNHGNLDENLSDFNILLNETLPQEPSTAHKSSTVEEIESADVDLTSDSEIDTMDYDVENVLQKQNTHDLYCPNCNSCITRKVILRKRKRKFRISSEDVKRNKLETAIESKPYVGPTQLASDQGHNEPLISLDGTPISSANGYHRDGEPELFRCLSCFSFFTPTGSGFKLFRIFGEKGNKENMTDEPRVTTNKSWFSSIFPSEKVKGSADQGKNHRLDVGKNKNEVNLPSSNLSDRSDLSLSIQETSPPIHVGSRNIDPQETGANILISQKKDLASAEKLRNDTVDTSDSAIMGEKGDPVNLFEVDSNHCQLNLSNGIKINGTINEAQTPAYETQESTEGLVDGTLSAPQFGLNILKTSNVESLILDRKQADKICDMEMPTNSLDDEAVIRVASPVSILKGSEGDAMLDILKDTPREFQRHNGSISFAEPLLENTDVMFQIGTKDGSLPYEVSQHTISNTKVEIHSKGPLKVDTDALISSVKDALSIQNKPVDNNGIPNGMDAASIAGNDTIITVEAGPTETVESMNLPNLATQIHIVEQQRTDAREGKEIEIIKSIVYGGLAEIITSLSIVSSAAAAGTATLYIFALGVANLVGGLLIILNNLWELKKDCLEQASNQIMDQSDRYRELLGRRENFMTHAIFAVLSYTIFGLVPPTVYSFSFRKSDDMEFKLILAAATSLLCIIVLATGKVYGQRAPKSYLKTIMFYVVLGFMVSGVSFAAGQIINRVLQKLGLFESSSEVNLIQPGVNSAAATSWASY